MMKLSGDVAIMSSQIRGGSVLPRNSRLDLALTEDATNSRQVRLTKPPIFYETQKDMASPAVDKI